MPVEFASGAVVWGWARLIEQRDDMEGGKTERAELKGRSAAKFLHRTSKPGNERIFRALKQLIQSISTSSVRMLLRRAQLARSEVADADGPYARLRQACYSAALSIRGGRRRILLLGRDLVSCLSLFPLFAFWILGYASGAE